jgi:hypothetical protein
MLKLPAQELPPESLKVTVKGIVPVGQSEATVNLKASDLLDEELAFISPMVTLLVFSVI